MKYLLPLLLISIYTNAQTKVNSKSYFKSYLVTDKTDTSVVVKKGGYADYSIYAPKSGVYTFYISVLNDVGIPTPVHLKLPTSKLDLASVAIPLNQNYQTVELKVKLATTNKAVRMLFDDDVTVSSFTYNIDGVAPTPTPVTSGVSQSDFNALKAKFDSLRNIVDTSWYELDPTIFLKKNGKITIPSLTTPASSTLTIQKLKSNADGSITIKKLK